VCGDAREFNLQKTLCCYTVQSSAYRRVDVVLEKLEQSLQSKARPLYVLYHNPLLEDQLRACEWLERMISASQFALYRNRDPLQS